MTGLVRSIRFARGRDAAGCPNLPDGETLIARVVLDEAPAPVGAIVSREGGPRWCYLHADGSHSGLFSALSRQDLERQVVLFHFGAVPAEKTAVSVHEPALRIAS
jgi:hypothetical protein